MKNFCNRSNLLIFLGGAATSLVTANVLKSKSARKAAVCTMSKFLKAKDDVEHALSSIKEEAEDMYAEAKQNRDCKTECESESKKDDRQE